MDLYTLPENQKMLWDTISKVPHFQQMKQRDPQKSELWFREIIQLYYNKNKHNIIDKNALRLLNKETVGHMLNNLKKQSTPQPASFQNDFQNNFSQLDTNTNETNNFILEQKQNKLNNEFQTLQNEYTNLFEKKKVKEIDFRENINEDKPIENMEELIKRQMAEREYDIQNIQKPEEAINLSQDVIELDKKEKTVTFSENVVDVDYDKKIDKINKKMDNFIIEFTEKFASLQNEITDIKNEQTKTKIENESINNAEKLIYKLRKIEKTTDKDEVLEESTN